MALILSDLPASTAAMFTTNRIQAAPVQLSREHLRDSRGKASAILVNAGNANCATRNGMKTAVACCKAAARAAGGSGRAGTAGFDGRDRRRAGPPSHHTGPARAGFGLDESRFSDVSHAIMTTDTMPKMAFAELPLNHDVIRIAGMAKGSGMIHPRMATTLCFVMTDAVISPPHLRKSLVSATERTFHRLTVDGDTSTNDTLVLMANGRWDSAQRKGTAGLRGGSELGLAGSGGDDRP